ncbi:helix-turn-helix domain-containing protein [Secundilactobacillus sp. HBUAS58055]|nr:helix-turn-helix transcriptional regulator [Secundilactobacillus angelensis]MCH5461518.1 helix-turn-helix domain-containing protein [Secundilactobacillus angelensis]
MVLWENITRILKLKHVSVRELCRLTGIPRQTLYNIKQGSSLNPSFYLILKIAEALDVSLDEFRKKADDD